MRADPELLLETFDWIGDLLDESKSILAGPESVNGDRDAVQAALAELQKMRAVVGERLDREYHAHDPVIDACRDKCADFSGLLSRASLSAADRAVYDAGADLGTIATLRAKLATVPDDDGGPHGPAAVRRLLDKLEREFTQCRDEGRLVVDLRLDGLDGHLEMCKRDIEALTQSQVGSPAREGSPHTEDRQGAVAVDSRFDVIQQAYVGLRPSMSPMAATRVALRQALPPGDLTKLLAFVEGQDDNFAGRGAGGRFFQTLLGNLEGLYQATTAYNERAARRPGLDLVDLVEDLGTDRVISRGFAQR